MPSEKRQKRRRRKRALFPLAFCEISFNVFFLFLFVSLSRCSYLAVCSRRSEFSAPRPHLLRPFLQLPLKQKKMMDGDVNRIGFRVLLLYFSFYFSYVIVFFFQSLSFSLVFVTVSALSLMLLAFIFLYLFLPYSSCSSYRFIVNRCTFVRYFRKSFFFLFRSLRWLCRRTPLSFFCPVRVEVMLPRTNCGCAQSRPDCKGKAAWEGRKLLTSR